MKKLIFALLLVALIVSPSVLAGTEVISASRGVTCKGATGVLVDLGLASVMPLQTSLFYYNWIAVLLLFFTAAMSSQRNMRFFGIFLPLFAALLAYFGWLNASNSAQMWGFIIGTGVLAVMIYMKDSNREKNGAGGPGVTILNIVFALVLLQTIIGMVNVCAIFNTNVAPTPSQFQNVDLSEQLNGISNAGGLLSGAISTIVGLLIAGILILVMLLGVLLSIISFEAVLLLAFPFLASSPLALGILTGMQIVIWITYMWVLFEWVYKPMPDGGYI